MHVMSFGNARNIYNEQQMIGYNTKLIKFCQIIIGLIR